MIKTIIKLVIAAFVINACWRSANVVLRYSNFRDAVHEMVLFSMTKSESEVEASVLELAQRYEVPVQPENVSVHRAGNKTVVTAVYTDQIELVPTKFYPWEFKVNDEAINVYMAPSR
jgi:hypothetical protein